MLKLKLTPVFMLAVICIAAFLPLAFGVSVASLGASASVVCIATFLCEKGSGFSSVRNAQRGEVGEQLKKVEAEYKQVTTDLKNVGDQLKAHAEAVQKEIKAAGDLSKETKAKVDELLTKQGELQARLHTAEQVLDKVGSRDDEPNRVLSLGSHVVESEAFKNVDWKVSSKLAIGINAAITSIDTSAGSLV
jgi:Skp family chaperone for outer membrane proteins